MAKHAKGIVDDDRRFSIDPVTRLVTNESENPMVLIQFDHDSERITFEMDRWVEGHDMASSTSAQIHYDNGEDGDRYDVDDLAVSPDDEESIRFTWLVSQNATQHVGPLTFNVKFRCYGEAGEVVYEWNTAVCDELEVREGKNNDGRVVEAYSDAIRQWREELDAAVEEGLGDVSRQVSAQVSEQVPAEVASQLERGLSDFVVIGGAEPSSGPVLWFDTEGAAARAAAVVLVLGGEEDVSDVYAGIDGDDHPVTNADAPVEADDGLTYVIEIG